MNNLSYYVGTGSSTEYGAELQVAYQFGEEFFVFGSGTLSSETFDEDTPFLNGNTKLATKGNQIPNTPQRMLKAGFTYAWNGFAFTPVIRFIGERYGNAENTQKVSSYTVTDLNFSYDIQRMFGLQEGTVRFSILNVFDKQYISQIAPNDTDLSSSAQYYLGAPRTFMGTVAVKF